MYTATLIAILSTNSIPLYSFDSVVASGWSQPSSSRSQASPVTQQPPSPSQPESKTGANPTAPPSQPEQANPMAPLEAHQAPGPAPQEGHPPHQKPAVPAPPSPPQAPSHHRDPATPMPAAPESSGQDSTGQGTTGQGTTGQRSEPTSAPPITNQGPHQGPMAPQSNTRTPTTPPKPLSRAEKKRRLILKEPVFNGNGLLVGAITSGAVVLGTGISLTVLYAENDTTCEYGYCYQDSKHPEWETFSSTLFTLGTLSATAIGISGGVVRARYDAWLSHHHNGKNVRARTHIAVGSSLIGLSAILFSAAITATQSPDEDVYSVGVPVFSTLGVLSATSGLTTLSYGASYLVRQRRMSDLTFAPSFQPQSETAGLAVSGRF